MILTGEDWEDARVMCTLAPLPVVPTTHVALLTVRYSRSVPTPARRRCAAPPPRRSAPRRTGPTRGTAPAEAATRAPRASAAAPPAPRAQRPPAPRQRQRRRRPRRRWAARARRAPRRTRAAAAGGQTTRRAPCPWRGSAARRCATGLDAAAKSATGGALLSSNDALPSNTPNSRDADAWMASIECGWHGDECDRKGTRH